MTKPTVNAKAAKDIADVWDVAVPALWDGPTLAAGIIESLDLRRPGLRVLDASCGNGMPGIFLNKAGVPVAMSDGSETMVACTRKACESALGADHGLDLRVAYWHDLPVVWGEASFDVILVRGNSLPYVLNWDSGCGEDKPDEDTLRAGYRSLVDSLAAIKRTLRPGGVLYVDCSQNCQSAADPYRADKTLDLPDGRSVRLQWNIAAYPEESVRRWQNVMTFAHADGSHDRVLRTDVVGLLCGPDHLRSILNLAGFAGFKRLHPKGEDVYVPFLAHLEDDAIIAARKQEAVNAVWNKDGSMSYGLFAGDAPLADAVPQTQDAEKDGALAGPNRALHAWQAERVRAAREGKPVTGVLDVACGDGQSTLRLAAQYRDSAGYVVGMAPDNTDLSAARRSAADSGVSVDFVSDSGPDSRRFSLAVSRCALSQQPAEARRAALQAAYAALEDGGVLQLDDRVAGSVGVCARTSLHYSERLGVRDAWSADEYAAELRAVGFAAVETTDLGAQQARSYAAAAKRAGDMARERAADATLHAMLRAMEHDYGVCAGGAAAGETGWAQFVCRK